MDRSGRRTLNSRLAAEAVGWHLPVMSHGVVLFTASTRSRREIEDLAAEARRLRPDVEIIIRPPSGAAYRFADRAATNERSTWNRRHVRC